jgi:hypothetical protein
MLPDDATLYADWENNQIELRAEDIRSSGERNKMTRTKLLYLFGKRILLSTGLRKTAIITYEINATDKSSSKQKRYFS